MVTTECLTVAIDMNHTIIESRVGPGKYHITASVSGFEAGLIMGEDRRSSGEIPEEGLKARLFRGAAYSLAGLLTTKAILVVNSIIMARLLGRESLGIYSIYVNLTSVVALFATLGVSSAVVKYVAEFDKKDPRKLQDIISISAAVVSVSSVLVAFVYIISSHSIAVNVYGNAALETLILIGSIGLVLGSIVSPFVSMVQGFQQIKDLNLRRILAALVSVPVTLLSIYFFGLNGAVMAGVFNSIVLAVVFWGIIRRLMTDRGVRLRIPRDRNLTKSVLNYAFPAFGSALMVVPAILVVTSMLVSVQGWEEMGLFRVAQGLAGYLLFVPSAIGIAFIPMLAETHASSPERISSMVARVFRMTLFITLPVALVLALFSKSIIPILYGSEYSGAWQALLLMSLATFLLSAGAVIGQLLAGIGKMWQGLGLNAIWMVVLISSSYLLISDFGVTGLALAFVVAYVVHTVAQVTYTTRCLQIRYEGLGVLLLVAFGGFSVSIPIVFLTDGLMLYMLSAIVMAVLVLVEYSLMSDYEKNAMKVRLPWLSRKRD